MKNYALPQNVLGSDLLDELRDKIGTFFRLPDMDYATAAREYAAAYFGLKAPIGMPEDIDPMIPWYDCPPRLSDGDWGLASRFLTHRRYARSSPMPMLFLWEPGCRAALCHVLRQSWLLVRDTHPELANRLIPLLDELESNYSPFDDPGLTPNPSLEAIITARLRPEDIQTLLGVAGAFWPDDTAFKCAPNEELRACYGLAQEMKRNLVLPILHSSYRCRVTQPGYAEMLFASAALRARGFPEGFLAFTSFTRMSVAGKRVGTFGDFYAPEYLVGHLESGLDVLQQPTPVSILRDRASEEAFEDFHASALVWTTLCQVLFALAADPQLDSKKETDRNGVLSLSYLALYLHFLRLPFPPRLASVLRANRSHIEVLNVFQETIEHFFRLFGGHLRISDRLQVETAIREVMTKIEYDVLQLQLQRSSPRLTSRTQLTR